VALTTIAANADPRVQLQLLESVQRAAGVGEAVSRNRRAWSTFDASFDRYEAIADSLREWMSAAEAALRGDPPSSSAIAALAAEADVYAEPANEANSAFEEALAAVGDNLGDRDVQRRLHEQFCQRWEAVVGQLETMNQAVQAPAPSEANGTDVCQEADEILKRAEDSLKDPLGPVATEEDALQKMHKQIALRQRISRVEQDVGGQLNSEKDPQAAELSGSICGRCSEVKSGIDGNLSLLREVSDELKARRALLTEAETDLHRLQRAIAASEEAIARDFNQDGHIIVAQVRVSVDLYELNFNWDVSYQALKTKLNNVEKAANLASEVSSDASAHVSLDPAELQRRARDLKGRVEQLDRRIDEAVVGAARAEAAKDAFDSRLRQTQLLIAEAKWQLDKKSKPRHHLEEVSEEEMLKSIQVSKSAYKYDLNHRFSPRICSASLKENCLAEFTIFTAWLLLRTCQSPQRPNLRLALSPRNPPCKPRPWNWPCLPTNWRVPLLA